MRRLTTLTVLAITILMGWSVARAPAGEWYCDTAPCPYDFEWQWFAPLHDICCDENPPAPEGWFASTEALNYWVGQPNSTPIGNPNPVVVAWLPNSVNYVFSTITTPAPPNITPGNNGSFLYPLVSTGSFGFQFNGIDEAYTRTQDGPGQRFEFGRINDDCGWMISLFNMNCGYTQEYGFDDKRLDQLGAAQGLDGIDGIPNNFGTGGAAVNPVAPVAGSPAILAVDGLLTVPVLFEDPFGLLSGFTDADGNQLPDDLNGDGVIDDRDLARIAVVFDDMSVRNRSRLNGAEIVAVKRKRRLHSGFDVEAYLGARYLYFNDEFSVLARGGTMADSSWDNTAINRIVGPELGFRASRQKRQWMATVHAKFLAGTNFLTINQTGTLADHLSTGAPGVPDFMGGNTFYHRLGDERFSPVGELRFEGACQVTRNINLRAGWTGMVIGNIARGSNTVLYRLPNLGIRNGSEEVVVHGVTVGIDINR